MMQRGCSPLTSLVKVECLALEVEPEKQVELENLVGLVLDEGDLKYFVALTLDLICGLLRWDELEVLKGPEVLSKMVLWEDKSRVWVGPKIFFVE